MRMVGEYSRKPMVATKVLDPPGSLQTERLSNGNRMLIRDLVVRLDDDTEITVPKGFVTDFSSVPGLARGFLHWSRVDIAGGCSRLPVLVSPEGHLQATR